MRVVLDASVLIRAAVAGAEDAQEWLEAVEADVIGLAPDLLWVEVANALVTAVRQGTVTPRQARAVLLTVLRLSLESTSLQELAPAALALGISRGLTAYDAAYVALADAEGAVLVTADRRLARAARRAEVLG